MDSQMCWFCEKEPPDSNAKVNVKIQGDELGRKKTGYKTHKVIYEGGTIEIPRCMKCKEIHESTKRRGLGCTFAFILPVALGYVLQEIFRSNAGPGSSTISGFIIGGIVCGVILSIIVGKRFYDFLRRNETKSENQKMQYPPVKELIEKGYKVIS